MFKFAPRSEDHEPSKKSHSSLGFAGRGADFSEQPIAG
jgi:hypothetical protein